MTRTLGRGREEQLRWKAQICLFICCKVKIKCFLLFHTSLVGRVEGSLAPSSLFSVQKVELLKKSQERRQQDTLLQGRTKTEFPGPCPRSSCLLCLWGQTNEELHGSSTHE